MIARLIGRCTILQNIYLPRISAASKEFKEALVRLYATMMSYLSKAKGLSEQNSVKRMLKSAIVTSDEFVKSLQDMVTEEQNVERYTILLDAEKSNSISHSSGALSISEDEKYAGLLDLRKLDGPVVRTSSQWNDIEILRWVSPQPYMEYHKRVFKHALSGTGR